MEFWLGLLVGAVGVLVTVAKPDWLEPYRRLVFTASLVVMAVCVVAIFRLLGLVLVVLALVGVVVVETQRRAKAERASAPAHLAFEIAAPDPVLVGLRQRREIWGLRVQNDGPDIPACTAQAVDLCDAVSGEHFWDESLPAYLNWRDIGRGGGTEYLLESKHAGIVDVSAPGFYPHLLLATDELPIGEPEHEHVLRLVICGQDVDVYLRNGRPSLTPSEESVSRGA